MVDAVHGLGRRRVGGLDDDKELSTADVERMVHKSLEKPVRGRLKRAGKAGYEAAKQILSATDEHVS